MRKTCLLTACMLSLALSARAETSPYDEKVTGDWGGTRKALSSEGVDLGAEYIGDFLGNPEGGVQRSAAYLDYLDMHANLDLEKLAGLKGNKARVLLLNDIGGTPNAAVGSRMGIDNNETFPHRFQLAEAWDEQQFFDGKLAVLVGFIDANDDFNATYITNNFLGPSFQLNDEIAQTAVPTFPANSLAARVTVRPTKETYIKVAVFQATPASLHTTDYHLGGSAGAFVITEAGLAESKETSGDGGTQNGSSDSTPDSTPDNSPNKIGIGGWTYTSPSRNTVENALQGIPSDNISHGVYLISSYQFYQENDKNLTAFFRPGFTDGETHSAEWAYTGGLVGTGWVPGRKDDDIGLGIEQTHQADRYIQYAAANGLSVPHNEYAGELYYRAKLYQGIKLQPDFQYILNPANAQGAHDALVLGLRVDADF